MNQKTGKILIVDDDIDVLNSMKFFIRHHVETVHIESNPHSIPTLLANESYDAILLDMNFTRDVSSGAEGFFWLNKILEIDSMAVVILITAYGDIGMAVRAIKEGAVDFIQKPWQNEKLLATLSSALNLRKARLDVVNLRSQQKYLSADLDRPYHDFIGESPEMRQVFALIDKVAGTDANVLILGENGTGKELVARELHRKSSRANGIFITVDMGAISETLFESELFGHAKGAFTGAHESRAGRFETASGGTLFLDEIGNLPLNMQSKLLTTLEERHVVPLGTNKPVPIDIRLISATNLPLQEMAAEKRFRQDLLYRINTVEIKLPPLRDRVDDIPLLCHHFLGLYSAKYKKPVSRIEPAVMDKLRRYPWPGNIRELRHAVERAVILSESESLRLHDFSLSAPEPGMETAAFSTLNLEEVEKIIIRKAIAKNGGNMTKAAEELGLTRMSLYRRMDKHGL